MDNVGIAVDKIPETPLLSPIIILQTPPDQLGQAPLKGPLILNFDPVPIRMARRSLFRPDQLDPIPFRQVPVH